MSCLFVPFGSQLPPSILLIRRHLLKKIWGWPACPESYQHLFFYFIASLLCWQTSTWPCSKFSKYSSSHASSSVVASRRTLRSLVSKNEYSTCWRYELALEKRWSLWLSWHCSCSSDSDFSKKMTVLQTSYRNPGVKTSISQTITNWHFCCGSLSLGP